MNATVVVTPCPDYQLDGVRQAVQKCLEPLGGMRQFVRPGMKVLLKPNLLALAELEQAVTTHPAVLQAVAEQVIAAGGEVLIGDSSGGPDSGHPAVLRKSGTNAVAEKVGAKVVLFDGVVWKRHNGQDYFIARPVTEVDLVINLPKLKTHMLTLFTGAVKNLFGVVPGERKREIHIRAIGAQDFSRELVNLLELVRPGLSILDGVLGQEGTGPGTSGTPHTYGCLAASTDPVALDAVVTRAMGYRDGDVLYLAQAAGRGIGTIDPAKIQVIAPPGVLDFGKLKLPAAHFFLRMPSWLSAPIRGSIKLQPRIDPALCNGCGKCAQVCPGETITKGKPARIDLDGCIGCMCCAEMCPQGAITARRGQLARLVGFGS
jgi:uncharacterized protein (DUF362 family)/NAD-dependent dihydropyrimidine dehydrogenase PreA subunit